MKYSHAPDAQKTKFVPFISALMLVTITVLGSINPVWAKAPPDSFADLIERLSPAVVNISSTHSATAISQKTPGAPTLPKGSPFEKQFKDFFNKQGNGHKNQPRNGTSLGSGFVIDSKGIIITNNHVIDGADKITVTFTDGTKLKATVIGKDAKKDLAVLKVEPEEDLVAVKFGDSDKARVGDWAIAIGNPYGLGGSVTAGIISAFNRNINAGPYDDFIQTDAAINHGNSGGPLFNIDGEVIGINTAIFSPDGGSIGLGFSIPSASALPTLTQLQEFGETRRGWLGVRIQNMNEDLADSFNLEDADGVLVSNVTQGSPAEAAGLMAGDVITGFNTKEINNTRDLARFTADSSEGSEIDLDVYRKGKDVDITVILGRLETAEITAKPVLASLESTGATLSDFGLEIADVTTDLKVKFNLSDEAKGVVVTEVDVDSQAAQKGIRKGDIIVEVAQNQVSTVDQVLSEIDDIKKTDSKAILFTVRNGSDNHFVALRIETEKS